MSDKMIMKAISPEDIVEARLIVELGTVTLAAARATEESLQPLRDLAEHAEQALASKTYTREISWDFHALLAVVAQNVAVEGLTLSFRSSLSMHPIRTREGAKAHERTVAEHRAILDALEKRDGVAARRLMATHLLRGTGLEERESQLLALWDARTPAQRAASRRAK
jgi:GntR family transcriptional repressor for pyruvate dehydrogenase complex